VHGPPNCAGMKRCTAALLGLLLLVGHSWAATPRSWALLVGVDRYDSNSISPLQFAGADARALAQTFIEACGFDRQRVVVLTSDGDPKTAPTSDNILEWLETMRGEVGPDDTFVFFFSGHGIERDGQNWLLTANTKPGSTSLLKKSALSTAEVRKALKGIRASRLVQIVDACRNDPMGGRGVGDNRLTNGMSRDLRAVPNAAGGSVQVSATLFACSVSQRSYEGYNGHGYFTYFLMRGLRGAAAREDGTVTLNSLVQYVEEKVPETVRMHEHGKVQVPYAEILGTGASQFVLARSSPVALKPTPSTALRQVHTTAELVEFLRGSADGVVELREMNTWVRVEKTGSRARV